jgi:hypothetical protein
MGFCKSRLLAAVLATTLLAACGGEGSGPTAFNPAAMQADLALSGGVESDPTVSALAATFDDMALATGGSGLAVSTAGLFLREPRSAQSTEQMSSVMTALLRERRHPAISASVAIPPEVAGTTYEYDVTTDHWVATDRTGAPVNGVRFILYTVDGAQAVVEPLDEIGYADLIDLSSGSTASGRIVVVADGTTWVDYRADATGDEVAGELNVNGYIRLPGDQWGFDLSMEYAQNDTEYPSLDLSSTVEFPVHGVLIDVRVTKAAGMNGVLSFTQRFESPNGRLDYAGGWSEETSPSLEIKVNGEPYAHLSGYEEADLVGNDGRVLTQDEKDVLVEAFLVGQFSAMTPLFLLAPMAGFVGGGMAF